MRRVDETPLDPEIEASLEAIDATLAGEAVDPRYADLAELALLLVEERPVASPEFERGLDEHVARRFAPAPPAPGRPSRARAWLWAPVGALASALVVATIIVTAGSPGGPQRTATSEALSKPSASSASAAAPHRTASGGGAAKLSPSGSASVLTTASASGATSALNGFSASSAAAGTGTLQPPPNGRKIIQGAQLALTTPAGRIDTVAQEVFDVVGQENGIVQSSNVTASSAPGAYAQFQLSVPSSALARTMASLSTLRYARVSSRTDTTQDVNDQYQRDQRTLADARALRTSLLKQLANATTQAQINSLTARIHDAEASISSDEATLRGLQHHINYSQIGLTINTPTPVLAHPAKSGGFTLGKASHDAGRVLTVAAGVALIALAALVPIALLIALAWWIAAAVRRRRREQALDLV
jgi:hypothetical protein